jgi:hypothetical protein
MPLTHFSRHTFARLKHVNELLTASHKLSLLVAHGSTQRGLPDDELQTMFALVTPLSC